MLITSLVNAFITVQTKLLLTVQQEGVSKRVLMDGLELIPPEDVNKYVLKDNLLIFFLIYVFKNVQLIQYFTVIPILIFVFNNVQK